MVKVLKAGFYSTIQDFGRFGYQQYGVPYSGVMDRLSASMANSILGNNLDTAVLEITMTGPTLQFLTDTFISISGADISPKLNENAIKLNKAIKINKGYILSFGKLNQGFRCYLAVLGGFDEDIVMNSQSMYKNITTKAMLLKNDELQLNTSASLVEKTYASIKWSSEHFSNNIIDVFKGPEFDLLSINQQKELFSKAFVISKNNNRMAYQLEETVQNELKSIITSAVLPGIVQLTPSGKLIVLMRDCQTTGGYPRVFQLTATAIDVLSQKMANDEISFNLCQL